MMMNKCNNNLGLCDKTREDFYGFIENNKKKIIYRIPMALSLNLLS